MSEEQPLSLWEASAVEEDLRADFDGDTTAEVAIVGGGYTGLSTALHASLKGVDCHVIEARQIGFGGSGRNAGLVNAGLWLPPQDVRAKMGDRKGAALVRLLGGGPEYVFSLIETYQIRCEATRNGTIHAAHAPRGMAELARRAAEWQRLGAPVRLLSRDEATDMIGSPHYHGGLLDDRAGTINPMGYARGLARAALAAGARISTGVRVTGLTRSGDEWQVATTRGTIRAKSVVIGTNAYSDDLWPGLRDSFMPIHYFQLATEPLGERGAGILPGRQGVWDTGRIMFSIRRDAFDRVIVGSMGTVIGGRTGLSRRWAARRLGQLFPDLGPVRFEAAWHGRIAMTADHLPRIHRLAEGLYTPVAYNGRGISPGTMFGKAMAELLSGGREEDLPMPITDLVRAPRGRLQAALFQAAFQANQLIRSF